MNKTTKKLIPIWQYCKEQKVSKQNVYRWIREGKVPKGMLKKITKTVERTLIDSSWQPKQTI